MRALQGKKSSSQGPEGLETYHSKNFPVAKQGKGKYQAIEAVLPWAADSIKGKSSTLGLKTLNGPSSSYKDE